MSPEEIVRSIVTKMSQNTRADDVEVDLGPVMCKMCRYPFVIHCSPVFQTFILQVVEVNVERVLSSGACGRCPGSPTIGVEYMHVSGPLVDLMIKIRADVENSPVYVTATSTSRIQHPPIVAIDLDSLVVMCEALEKISYNISNGIRLGSLSETIFTDNH